MKQSLVLLLLALTSISTGHAAAPLSSAATHAELKARIKDVRLSRQPLLAIGDREPTEGESRTLAAVLDEGSSPDWAQKFEHYLESNPESPWVPAAQNAYALLCREMGRHTPALRYWEKTWQMTKHFTSGPGKETADLTLANWCELLSKLGRAEKLGGIFRETQGRTMAHSDWQRQFQGAKEAYAMMLSHPGVAFRCGSFAVKSVGEVLQPENAELVNLLDAMSPTNGFSLAELSKLSTLHQLGLAPVRRISGTELIVPSVIHWREQHYAAIVEKNGDAYRVVDPTFRESKWLLADSINEEASGYFMVPREMVSSTWRILQEAEADAIRGRGLYNQIEDEKDEGCRKQPAGPTECPPCAKGMPQWWISEPYVSLWLADEPLVYSASGGEISFRMLSKQRETRPSDGYFGVAPTPWNHNWFSYVYMVNEAPCIDPLDPPCRVMNQYDATVFLAEGGQRKYRLAAPDHEPSRTRLIPTGGHAKNGVKLIHPDGSVDYYQDLYNLNNPGTAGELYLKMIALRTRHVDQFGRTTRFYYESPNGYRRVKYVVDYDGRTNTLSYTSNDLLSQVTDPYGRSALFHYDGQNRLTNIVDVAGMTSSIAYDSKGYVTNLVTPYGTTSFEITETEPVVIGTNTNDFAGHNLIHRSVKVTEPVGSKQLYIFRFDSESFMPVTYSGVPSGTPLGTLDDGTVGTNHYRAVSYRNSFFWNAKQYAGLSTEIITNLTSADYTRGRMRHWLQNSNDTTVTGILSIEQEPSPDGIAAGQKTFYDYRGKTSRWREGSETLVAVSARVLPNSQTQYTWNRYNQDGYLTNYVSTYAASDTSVATRTNIFVYAANVATNLDTISGWPDLSENEPAVYNLLVAMTNAAGERVFSADYPLMTSSNTFGWKYGSSWLTSTVYRTTHRTLPSIVTNGVGDFTRYTYGVNGNVTSVTAPSGLLTTNTYDATGFLLKTVGTQIQRTNSFGYSNGNLATQTNELGLAVTHTWDNLQRLTSTSYPDGTFTSNRYDRLDLSATRDRMGKWSYFQHDAVQHLVAFTNANTNVTRFGYCGCGSLEAITNALQEPTTFTYDNQLRRTGVSLVDGTSLTYKYDSIGRLTNVVDGASRSDTFYYNHQGRLTALSNSLGRALAIVYDKEDRPTHVTDENGITVTNVFDNLNRIVSRSYPDGGVETFTYSTNGLIRHTNQLGQFTRFAYDAAGRTIAVTNAEQQVTQFKYDPSGNITNLLDGKNQVTKWVYDQYGLLRDKIGHLGNYFFSASYDANGRLINRWTPEKGEAGFYYDPAGNLTNIDYAASLDVRLTYDAIERLKTMSDAAGTTVFDYTATGQLRSEDGPWENDTISYGYSQGLRHSLSLQQPNASPWSQTYGYATGARRLDNVTSPAGTFDYYYLPQKPWLPATIGFPGGAYINNSYDVVGQLSGTWLQNSADATLNAHTYGYDKWGQRTAVTNLAGDYRQYGHDKIGQLKTAFGFESGGTTRLQEKHGYAYDAAGNLAYRTNNAFVQTVTNNTLNQLTSIARSGTLTVAGVTDGPATNATVNSGTASLYSDGTFAKDGFVPVDAINIFTAKAYDAAGRGATNDSMMILPENANYVYDLNGNLRTNSNQYITFRTYDYDDENQLIRITEPTDWKTEFTYDGLRRCRVRKEFDWKDGVWALTKEVRYIYDGNLVIQERDGFNLPQVTYTRGLDLSGSFQGAGGIGGLLARTEGALNPQQSSTFYHADANGNVTAVIDAQQNVVARYQYDPFGTLISSKGSKADANVYRFSSKEIHAASGLYSFGYRFYDPKLQRWINRDPIGEEGGINLYGFVGNSPIDYVDPLGLELFWYDAFNNDTDFASEEYRRGYLEGLKMSLNFLRESLRSDFVVEGPDGLTFHGGMPPGGNVLGKLLDKFKKWLQCRKAAGVLSGSLDGLTAAERNFIKELLAQGKNVEIIPRGAGKTADFLINGISTELKTLTIAGPNTLKNAIENAARQGKQIVIDARNVAVTGESAAAQIQRAQGNIGGLQGRVTVLTSAGPVTF